jgi:hypothetical protein
MVMPLMYHTDMLRGYGEGMEEGFCATRESNEAVADIISDGDEKIEVSDYHRELAWCLHRYSKDDVDCLKEGKNRDRFYLDKDMKPGRFLSYYMEKKRISESQIRRNHFGAWPLPYVHVIIDPDYNALDFLQQGGFRRLVYEFKIKTIPLKIMIGTPSYFWKFMNGRE